ncbi:hypothetical protein ASPWEDRAFT_173847 [Aspergillus wentii DTO 134E9]|uniref:Uncharacterized protein n=1 Tax=Aspergillus wentii DTO 134E9 TaxID=1073089 RepID=A0A1L9RHV8_ASPWE|nr:uncharacterized protein ASPWEDRAFT_173847 [Aspergillus wentii DTO 134E9]OJJ34433.1 hypothetical protein ASPWEDRAFT_173847 [Aspergillus wentii DTO 134E9]
MTRITRSGKGRDTTASQDEQPRARNFRQVIQRKKKRILRRIEETKKKNDKKYWLDEADRLKRALRKEEQECHRKRARIAKCLSKVEAMEKGKKMEEDKTQGIKEAEHDEEEEYKQEDYDEDYYKEEDDDDGHFP